MRRDLVTSTVRDVERYERAHGHESDHSRHERWNEAAESDFSMPFTDCGSCNKPHCLMCALDRVFDGWRPAA